MRDHDADEALAVEADEADETETHDPAPGSLLDRLRQVRADAASDYRYDLLVPGYRGLVAIRCKPIPGRTSSQLATRLVKSKSPEAAFEMAADTLIAACEEVIVRSKSEDDWQTLGSLNGGEPVGIGTELVELLQLEPREGGRSREVVRSLFGLAPSPELALGGLVGEYLAWAAASDEELDEAFAGNSPGAGS